MFNGHMILELYDYRGDQSVLIISLSWAYTERSMWGLLLRRRNKHRIRPVRSAHHNQRQPVTSTEPRIYIKILT
jgi:hypothetical protein